jgi:hypothetical protein
MEEMSDERVRSILSQVEAWVEQDAPAVCVEQWQSDDEDESSSTYTDFTVGDGPIKVMIGTYDGEKAGVELVIGGSNINDKTEEVLTLADVRQLRDNLTALLSDERLCAAAAA